MIAPCCWMVCDSFVPYNTPGTLRNVYLCRELARQGFEVVVIAPESDEGSAVDEELAQLVPQRVKVLRAPVHRPVHAVARLLGRDQRRRELTAGTDADRHEVQSQKQPGQGSRSASVPLVPPFPRPPGEGENGDGRGLWDWLSWWLHTPDGKVGWLLPAVGRGLREARRRRPDVIFSSAPMFTSHLAAMWLRRLTGARWLADFRDPWTDNAWRAIPYAAHRRCDAMLERRVVAAADAISATSDSVREQLAAAFPDAAAKMATVLNGFAPAEIDAIEPRQFPRGQCVLVHTGTFYGPRSPRPLFEGLAMLAARRAELAARLRVVLIGGLDYEGQNLAEMADKYGAGAVVEVLPALPRREAISYAKGADAAIVFGQRGPQSVELLPAKTYEYVGAGRGVLGVATGGELRAWSAKADAAIGRRPRRRRRWRRRSTRCLPRWTAARTCGRRPTGVSENRLRASAWRSDWPISCEA